MDFSIANSTYLIFTTEILCEINKIKFYKFVDLFSLLFHSAARRANNFFRLDYVDFSVRLKNISKNISNVSAARERGKTFSIGEALQHRTKTK